MKIECPTCRGEGIIDNPEHLTMRKRGLPPEDVEKMECLTCDGIGQIEVVGPPPASLGESEFA